MAATRRNIVDSPTDQQRFIDGVNALKSTQVNLRASQLGIGAYRALVEEELDGHMVSVSGQLQLQYVEFSKLVNPQTLLTDVRFIENGSDFHRLARFLEAQTGRWIAWSPGLRQEPKSETPSE